MSDQLFAFHTMSSMAPQSIRVIADCADADLKEVLEQAGDALLEMGIDPKGMNSYEATESDAVGGIAQYLEDQGYEEEVAENVLVTMVLHMEESKSAVIFVSYIEPEEDEEDDGEEKPGEWD